ncbi:MAG: amidohydrolase, partial [bacterium]
PSRSLGAAMPIPRKETVLLLEHVRVITMDPSRPRAEAVLCRKGVIEAVGTEEELEELLRPTDTRFDCGELVLVPGFIDSHTHFLAMGLDTLRVDLSEARDRKGLLGALRARVRGTPKGEWIFGVNFDESKWAGERALPAREELDARVSEEHPVVARRVCGHIGVANTLALERIGPEWTEVDRDTGLLKEDVVLRLSRIVGVTDEEARKAIETATRAAYESGVTTVVDLADQRTFRTYMAMDYEGQVAIRLFCAVEAREFGPLWDEGYEVNHDPESGMVRLLGMKAFLDGSLGARTAALSEPYADDPGTKGDLLVPEDELRGMVRWAEERRLQLFLHAIGDRAVDVALDAIGAEAADGNPLRHRIEHLEYARPEQLGRMKELRVIASMQPNFAHQWSHPGGMNEERLGPERASRTDACREVWSEGIPLAFGSDCMPFGPMTGLQGAVNHPVEDQSLPPVVALRAYTSGSAWAIHAEDWLGAIIPGMAADLVLLSEDPDEAEDLSTIRPILTVLGGFLVHIDSEGFNRAVNRSARRALEQALMDTEAPPGLGLDGPRDEEDEE